MSMVEMAMPPSTSSPQSVRFSWVTQVLDCRREKVCEVQLGHTGIGLQERESRDER